MRDTARGGKRVSTASSEAMCGNGHGTELFYESPLGVLEIRGCVEGVTFLGFSGSAPEGVPEKRGAALEGVWRNGGDALLRGKGLLACLERCAQELDEYFDGTRRSFSVPLCLAGTPFQRSVWNVLRRIPYGETFSYQDVARAVGNERALRAVGGANNRNPVGILVPCHRVIGKDGRLVGYGGGLWRKEWLLAHERSHAEKVRP
ncbi:methylated-DNA--[protein]-cysteine S-methyltransferase [Aminiphilus circumscriptus]|jgi:methylated-DNA-[protein]-cysteine S-methyltransferase|uniref:methylated-DNA--[protein]-cysteine S-methyltransferase n=1 Tax=Aminiphilus circumscriptus TaxID=290732 RepID=UPI0004786251|nr:methylated-DNA--[protein]-cysteine S-methyltransferase [Aminiphilus circumscriptus]